MKTYLTTSIFCLILCCCMLLAACTPAQEQPVPDFGEEGNMDAVALTLTETDGSNRYTVVRPDLKGTNITKNAAVSIRNALATAIGKTEKDVKIITDWTQDPASTEIAEQYEILVGETNRPESIAAMQGLDELTYVIRVDGKKIVLVGGSENALRKAAAVFIDTYLADPSKLTESLQVSGQCEAPITGAHLVQTVYPTEDSVVADIMPFEMGYDVDPTGVKDSTAGIQQALNDCAALGGGTVFLSVGQYRVTKTITVSPLVTLRGDWQDPDQGNEYGTVIIADVSENVGAMLSLSNSSGVRGLTFYYPHQSMDNPKDLGWTIEFRRDGSQCANVMDITLINAYNGIGFCQAPYQAAACSNGWFRNIKGTALNIGFSIYNNTGACSYEQMKFSPSYWLAAGEAYKAPDKAVLESYLRENATAFVLGDLEMPLIYKLEADGYKYGIYIADGQRFKFWGSGMAELNITDCGIAMYIEAHYPSRMSGIVRSTLYGSEGSIVVADNAPRATLLISDCDLSEDPQCGPMKVTIYEDGDSEESYPIYTGTARATNHAFFNVVNAPYNCPMQPINAGGKLGELDATAAIQAALDDAARAGGGVVYLPAGYYRIEGYLTVPAGVELRGAGSTPMAPGPLGGTILLIYSGKDPVFPESEQASITVKGAGAGIRNVQFLYPENPFADPTKPETLIPYTYTIRLDAEDTFVSDVFFSNPYLAIDATENADDHYIKRLGGTAAINMVHVGACAGGWIETLHDINPTYWMQGNARYGLGVEWMEVAEDLGAFVAFQQAKCDLIVIEGTQCEYILDVLQFGGCNLIVVDDDGYVVAWNVSIDQGGSSCVTVNDGMLVGMNVERTFSGKDGKTVVRGTGGAMIFNEFHLE